MAITTTDTATYRDLSMVEATKVELRRALQHTKGAQRGTHTSMRCYKNLRSAQNCLEIAAWKLERFVAGEADMEPTGSIILAQFALSKAADSLQPTKDQRHSITLALQHAVAASVLAQIVA